MGPAPTGGGADRASVEEYYDSKVPEKLRDYVDGNARVSAALSTVESAMAGRSPEAVLDIGCGVGQVADALANRWPGARVVGVDVSAGSIAVARRLFGREGLTFLTARASELAVSGPFDLVTLIDVFEHIAVEDRPALSASLADLLSPQGVTVMTVPTPAFQRWLKGHSPEAIQPVDEDVYPADLSSFASAVGGRLIHYSEVSVWRAGDYAHAIIAMGQPSLASCDRGVPLRRRVTAQLARRLPAIVGRQMNRREARRQRVEALAKPGDG